MFLATQNVQGANLKTLNNVRKVNISHRNCKHTNAWRSCFAFIPNAYLWCMRSKMNDTQRAVISLAKVSLLEQQNTECTAVTSH